MKNQVFVETKKVRFPTAPELYGLFFEDINHAADGGLYPEMIRNRAFEDSLVPEGCIVDENQKIFVTEHRWPGAFNHGEGMDEWEEAVPETGIPGWYAENAVMRQLTENTLNENRKAALSVNFDPDGKIYNIGYAGMYVQEGEKYHFYFMLQNRENCHFTVSLEDQEGNTLAESEVEAPASKGYRRLDCFLTASGTSVHGRMSIRCRERAEAVIGFTSLMPEKTFMGHGLREDLALALKKTHARFLRFPGGCVVEGINERNSLRFSRTIGPVWERPGCQLMWHYRTTNGLGFHEYLQLCEDLEMEAMYVCNCGMDCQARHGGGFSEKLVEEYLEEALHALEYALGSTDTEYGAMRAKAGHPEPFRLKYVEIGNENWGPEYFERYEKFYRTLKAAWPEVIYLSNAHTEREGLPTEYADEHYYNAPEFFLENTELFNDRDRKGPKIFLGEYAVNGGNTIASMECALAEAAFLTGVEKNQDLVRLTAYAPLFQNSDYTAWKPNLIVFNNHQVYGIPSYHAISLMGKYRGKEVVSCRVEGEKQPPAYCGIPGILCEKEGLLFRNVKINGKEVPLSKMIYGACRQQEDGVCMVQGGTGHRYTGKSKEWNEAFEAFITDGPFRQKPVIWGVFGQENLAEYTFEAELKFEKENPVTLSVWNFHPDTDAGCNEPKDMEWNLRNVRNQIWRLEQGKSSTRQPGLFDPPLQDTERKDFRIDYSVFNHYKMIANADGYDCYINEVLVDQKRFDRHPVIHASAEADGDMIYLKLVSVAKEAGEVEIIPDCPVEADIETEVLSASPQECNSFEAPQRVAPVKGGFTCEKGHVLYRIPAHSVSVLKIRKRREN